MATEACFCGSGMGSLGLPNCVGTEGVHRRDIFVPLYDSTGARNSIAAGDLVAGKVTEAYIIGKLDETDASKRWQITPYTYKNGAPARTDDTSETAADGSIRILSRGVRTYSNELWDVPPTWAGQFNSGNCQEFGVYRIDETGKLGGELSDDKTELYPRAIEINSAIANENEAVDGSSGQKIVLTYQLSKNAVEKNFFTISATDISANLLTVRAQVEGSLVFVSSSEPTLNTELVIDAKSYLYGSFNTFTDVTGLDADSNESPAVTAENYWTVTKAGASLTIANVTESATVDGRYTIELSTVEDGSALVVGCNKGRGKATDVKYYFDNIDITG
jgi:hypothetical protein